MLLLFSIAILFLWIWLIVPRPLIQSPYSTVIESSDGQLLGARIADDGQWRFPQSDSIPEKFEKCLLTFEDRYFYYHPGINPVSLISALIQNIKQGEIVSGGSTITMQLCRIARKGRKRNYYNKLVEMLWALNLELRFSKKEILIMYASNAPYGGNVVGLDAASWRYYNRPPEMLSWSESATLAVLPNAPSLIYPGKRDNQLLEKRNRLLKKLFDNETLDSLTYELSLLESLAGRVFPLPANSYHLLERVVEGQKGKRVKTTINKDYQDRVSGIVETHNHRLKANHINNLAAIVAEVKTGKVLAYIGNVSGLDDTEHGNHVDIIRAPRSTGSILKPFLYAAMMESGILSPTMLVPDIPTRFGGFTPLNFNRQYDGAVRANEALARSLNVPAVRMLQDFGIEPFYEFLKTAGMTTLNNPPDHYGLSLILGGSETTLWDLTGIYVSMARILRNYGEEDGFYGSQSFFELNWNSEIIRKKQEETGQPVLHASSVYEMLKALLEVKRPGDEEGWQSFASARKIAWKTGTSFGFRDAWAVGITKDFVVSVWAGNADGEGRSGLTGAAAAAPLMFDIFGILPQSNWFSQPYDELQKVVLCSESGFLPSQFCQHVDTLLLPRNFHLPICPYHKLIHLDKTEKFQVSNLCENPSDMIHKSWFILPPVMEFYYKQKNPLYNPIPPFKPGCSPESDIMDLIYPRDVNRVFIPVQLDGTPGDVLFEVVHQYRDVTIFWNIDSQYLGTTSHVHQKVLHPNPGWHNLVLTDDTGNQLTRKFFVQSE